jgi:hypothetical protein
MYIIFKHLYGVKIQNSEVYATEFSDSLPVHGLMMPNMPPLAFPLVVKAATLVQDYVEESRPPAVEVRSFFPETWLWELEYIG